VAGEGASEARHEASQVVGVCPQFDLVWPELSIEDHLYFFARCAHSLHSSAAIECLCSISTVLPLTLTHFVCALLVCTLYPIVQAARLAEQGIAS
jgi:hypothetical protein